MKIKKLMRKRQIKTILIILGVVFGGLILINFAQAQEKPIEVEFEKTPLFSEANFLPGDSVTRWVKVTNNSEKVKKIGTEAINVSDPDEFGRVLILKIEEDSQILYEVSLSEFFSAGEVFLSEVNPGESTTYYFTISFEKDASNEFQEKSLGFDLLVGVLGEEGIPDSGGGGGKRIFGRGGGAVSVPGLVIKNEGVLEVSTTTAVITWMTSYRATSRVIYGAEWERHQLDLSDNEGDLPKYGYEHTTQEFNTPALINGTTTHKVILTGLIPNTTYYYRCVSRASPPTISRELSFKTLPLEKGFLKEKEEEREVETKEFETSEVEIAFTTEKEEKLEEEKVSFEGPSERKVLEKKEEKREEEKKEEEVSVKEIQEGKVSPKGNRFLAFLGNLGFGWLIVLLLLIVIGILVYLLNKRRKRSRL